MIDYKFFMTNLKMSKAEAERLIKSIKENSHVSSVLSLDEDFVLGKMNILNNLYGFNKKQYLIFPQLLTLAVSKNFPTIIIEKTNYLNEKFGLDNTDFQRNPGLIGYDIKSMEDKYDFYHNVLGFDEKHIKNYPALLGLDTTSTEPLSVQSKIVFYNNELGFTPKQFRSLPSLLGYDTTSNDPTSIKAKIDFFKNVLGFDKPQFIFCPSVLGLDIVSDKPTSVKSKLSEIKKLGIDISTIKQNPLILTAPAPRLRPRYAILSLVDPDKKFLAKNWATTTEQKTYARFRYLSSQNMSKITPYMLLMGERDFKSQFKVSSEDLMKIYPLTEEALNEIYSAYEDIKIIEELEEKE